MTMGWECGGRIVVGSNTGLFCRWKAANGVYLIAMDGDFRKNLTEKRCGCKFASAKEVWLVG